MVGYQLRANPAAQTICLFPNVKEEKFFFHSSSHEIHIEATKIKNPESRTFQTKVRNNYFELNSLYLFLL